MEKKDKKLYELILERRRKFNELIKSKNYLLKEDIITCPCCAYPKKKEFDICPICWWQDEGYENENAKIVRGGPNGYLSLEQARINFSKTLNCGDTKKLSIKEKTRIKKIMKLFDDLLINPKKDLANKAFKELKN